jgi:hypothetical protein
MSRVLVVMGVLGSLALAACDGGGEQQNTMTNPAIEEQAGKLLEALKAEDYETLLAQYDESFLKTHSSQAWVEQLKEQMAERGTMRSYVLRKAQADTRFSGKFFILEYESVHDGNKRLHHLLTLRSPVEGGDIQLIGHKVTPWERDS